jgi:hypothetical protein
MEVPTSCCITIRQFGLTWIRRTDVTLYIKVIPLFIARQRLGKHVPAATNTRKIRRIVARVFCAARVLSKQSVDLSAYPPLVAR